MRIGIGIGFIGLLIGVAIWSYIAATYTQQVASSGIPARETAAKIAGQDDATGMKFKDSITLAGEESGGRLRGIRVTAIVAGGPMQKHLGLQQDDLIVEVGLKGSLYKVNDITGGAEMVKDLVIEAAQFDQQLMVVRAGQRIILPQPPGTVTPAPITPAPGAIPAPSPTPTNTPAPTPPPKKNTIHDQVDAITKPR